MKANALSLSVVLLAACAEPEPAEPPAAPDPIGAELMNFNIVFGSEIGCSHAYLYRAGRALQYQCFAVDGGFSWENRGTLSAEGLARLEEELAAADFSNTAPGEDKNGLCKASESSASETTLWVGDESFTYKSACPTAGIQALHEALFIIVGDISTCMELDLLESVEPGCRLYGSPRVEPLARTRASPPRRACGLARTRASPRPPRLRSRGDGERLRHPNGQLEERRLRHPNGSSAEAAHPRFLKR